jgi:hypothetical protein
MIIHCDNPAIHPMDTKPTPPAMAVTIGMADVTLEQQRLILSIDDDGTLFGMGQTVGEAVDEAIVECEKMMEREPEQLVYRAFTGFLKAIKIARETRC